MKLFRKEKKLNKNPPEPQNGEVKSVGEASVKNTGYSNHGASRTSKATRGWHAPEGTADQDITNNIPLLRTRSKDLFMGSPIATGALKVKRSAVIGRGLRAKPNVDHETLGISIDEARKIELDIERVWSQWSRSVDCDASRMHNFYTLQRLLKLNMDLSGDIFWSFAIKPRGLTINLIDASRVGKTFSKKNQAGGIERDGSGEIVAYHIKKMGEFQTEYQRYPAFSKRGERLIYQLFEPERIGQSRGTPALAPVIVSLKQMSRYTESEITKNLINSMLTAFITKDRPTSGGLNISNIPTTKPSGEEGKEEEVDNSIKLGQGNIVELEEGEDVKTVAPNNASSFNEFVNAVSTQIGAALEIPVDILLKEFKNSYSASRAALLEFWKVVRAEREYIIDNFCQPVYEKFLVQSVARGELKLPSFFENKQAYMRCKWIGENKGHLDPVKEVMAAQKRVELGISTREIEAGENGGNWEEIVKQSLIEAEKLKEVNSVLADSK